MKDRSLGSGAGVPPVLRDALAAARAQGPTADDLARLAARLPLGGGGPAGGGPAGGGPPAPAVAAPPSVLSGVAIGALLAGVVVGAGLLWPARSAPPTPAPPTTTEVSLAPSVERVAAPAPAASDAPAAQPAAPPSAAPVAATAAPPPARDAKNDPAAPSASPAVAAPTGSADGVGTQGSSGSETEAQLLERARNALGASPGQALALSDEHARRFPRGALGQEREVVAIQALSQLGRRDEARRRAERFLAAFPASAHRRRIEAIVTP